MKSYYILLICFIVTLLSCNNRSKSNPVLIDFSTTSLSENYASGTIFCVPYVEKDGIKWIHNVEINGLVFDMIFDTGCSSTTISSAEAMYLLKQGKLTEEDFSDEIVQAQVADGSVVEGLIVNLKQVCIGDLCFDNVEAVVMDNMESPLLLGNSVLNRLTTYTIDNENQEIIFEIK